MADDTARNIRTGGSPTTTTTTTITTSHYPSTQSTTTTTQAGPVHSTSDPQSTTVTHPTIITTNTTERRPSIRIRRIGPDQTSQPSQAEDIGSTLRRSSSEPRRPPWLPSPQPADGLDLRRLATATATPLRTLHEEGSGTEALQTPSLSPHVAQPQRPNWKRQSSAISLRARAQANGEVAPEYEAHVVDVLDVIDPEVSTLTTLNNVQNSLFIPNLGSFYRRQPTYNLSQSSPDTSSDEEAGVAQELPVGEQEKPEEAAIEEDIQRERPVDLSRVNTISSVLTGVSEGHNYAVLPHGTSIPGWTEEEKAALNDHVRHLLHSRRARFRRSMRGFGRYVRKPVGFFVTLYAFLLTFWGAAWVLFLIGWISVGDRQEYFIEICDQILTALFCVVGIGFAPWRAVDTYHMAYVALYAHKTWRLRKDRGLPKLRDRNELPSRPATHAWELGEDPDAETEEIVLTSAQQQSLEHHQGKLAKSHTFYKPHETTTHRAFSVRLLIAIVTLLDCHSLFQMALGATTWGIYYKNRPKALTAVILSCSISCNIAAGILISVGDRRSRKKLVVEQMFRQGLTEEALKKLRKDKGLNVKGLGSQKKKSKKRKVDS